MQRSSTDTHGGEGVTYTPPKYNSVVIFCHGLGDTGRGWEDLAQVVQRQEPRIAQTTKFIFPTAPTRPITLNMGFPMPAWADIIAINPDAAEDKEGYAQSFARIKKIIDEEVAGGISSKNIVLGGFSLGGALTYYTIFHPDLGYELAGAVALSSWAPNLARDQKSTTPAVKKLFHGHGSADPLVSAEWGKSSAQFAKEAGCQVELKLYPNVEHSACMEEFADVVLFLLGVLEKS